VRFVGDTVVGILVVSVTVSKRKKKQWPDTGTVPCRPAREPGAGMFCAGARRG